MKKSSYCLHWASDSMAALQADLDQSDPHNVIKQTLSVGLSFVKRSRQSPGTLFFLVNAIELPLDNLQKRNCLVLTPRTLFFPGTAASQTEH